MKTDKDIDAGHLPSLNYWVSKTKLLTVDLSTSVTKTDLKAFCLVLDFQRLQSAHLDSEIACHHVSNLVSRALYNLVIDAQSEKHVDLSF